MVAPSRLFSKVATVGAGYVAFATAPPPPIFGAEDQRATAINAEGEDTDETPASNAAQPNSFLTMEEKLLVAKLEQSETLRKMVANMVEEKIMEKEKYGTCNDLKGCDKYHCAGLQTFLRKCGVIQ